MDDTELLRRYVEEGSEAAFSELVGRYVSLVHSISMRQVGGDYHRAEDVTQLVFVALSRKAASLVRHTALSGWFYTSTYFSAATLMREERRRQKREEKAQDMNALSAHADPMIDWDQLRPVLDEVMIELNSRDREAVVWRYFDRLPLSLIGARLGVSENTAGMRVNRALERVRELLTKRGAPSTTAALALMLADHAVVAAPTGLAETIASKALAAVANAGTQTSWLLKYLGKAKSAVGVSGAIWAGGILGISGIGVAGYELWAAWRANQALAQANEDYEAQQQSFWTSKRAADSAQLAVAQAERAHAAIRDPKANFQRFLAAYPQARTAIVADQKGVLELAYGSFFRSAGLTASQIMQFENAVIQKNLELMTLTPRKLAIAGPPMPPEDQMRALLGDRAFQQLQDYSQTVYAHYLASKVAENVATVSFSADQLDQLAQILASNNANLQPAYALDQSSLATIDWGKVSAQAKAAFSAAEWKAVEPALLTYQALGAMAATQGSPGSAASP